MAVAAAILVALGLLAVPAFTGPQPTADNGSGSQVVILVTPGDTVASLAPQLERKGIINSALAFRLYARLTGRDGNLSVGEVRLRPGMSYSEVLDALERASPRVVRIAIPEGLRLEEIADRLAQAGLVTDSKSFLALARPRTVQSPLIKGLPDGATLEGYLYPDTYDFPSDIAPEEIVRAMVANLQRRLGNLAYGSPKLTLHEILTLASIVEREAQVPQERPVIASVYLNRLKAGMPLQADPTVQYAVGVPGQWWKKDLTTLDLKVDSPYNTYLHPGLPPGPICSPGLASIEAVLFPADTDYLYFVAKGDGTHAFSNSLEEHNENVRRYRGP
jgi:UPF0755 protein